MSLEISFAKANIIRLTINTIPTLIEYSRVMSETGDPLIFSIPIITNCPPSRMGMGKRFKRPRLMLSNATMDRKVTYPAFAADPARTEICMGPPRLSADIDPLIIFPIEEIISSVYLLSLIHI